MSALLFRCPNTGRNVQGWLAKDAASTDEAYEAVSCAACRQMHFVNRKTGKTLGEGKG